MRRDEADWGQAQEMMASLLADEITPDDSGHIVWPFAKNAEGYARVWVPKDKTTTYVGQLVLEKFHGPKPTPEHTMGHKCNHPPCVWHEHLEWQTMSQQNRQRTKDGTHNFIKFSDAEIDGMLTMRSTGASTYAIAREFDASPSYISRLLRGKRRARQENRDG